MSNSSSSWGSGEIQTVQLVAEWEKILGAVFTLTPEKLGYEELFLHPTKNQVEVLFPGRVFKYRAN